MELEGDTEEGAEMTAEELATEEGDEVTAEGGEADAGKVDGLTTWEGEDGVNADMMEGMIVAAQQWEQELLMFDNEVTQELEGADCTSSGVAQNSADQPGVTQEELHSSGNHGPAELTDADMRKYNWLLNFCLQCVQVNSILAEFCGHDISCSVRAR